MQVLDRHLDKVFNEHLSEFLPHLQIPILWIEQILNLLLVYLVEGDVDFPVEQGTFLALGQLLFEETEDEVEGGGDHTLRIETYLV
jgi:hypothetical protein